MSEYVEIVYFFRAHAKIKVGTTAANVNVRRRQIELEIGEPLETLGTVPGGTPLERAIHKNLKPFSIYGEWFSDQPVVQQTIDRLLAEGPSAIGFTADAFDKNSLRRRRASKPPLAAAENAGTIAKLIWGNSAASELAALAEVDIKISQAWLDLTVPMPRVVRCALAVPLNHYCLKAPEAPMISFIGRA